MSEGPHVAYFSMEIALEPSMRTYAGGLGVLAGDTVRSCADLSIRMTAISLLHRKGYFEQELDREGNQTERPGRWRPEALLRLMPPRITVDIAGRPVVIRAWCHTIEGVTGHTIPVYLLDTDLPENHDEDRRLTDHLYGGDDAYRLRQEVVLGIGGVALLRAMGRGDVDRYHLNEGHAALVALTLAEEAFGSHAPGDFEHALEMVRQGCVFTTHTPVPAGHDCFPSDLVAHVLGPERTRLLARLGIRGELNMTELALVTSRFVNGVAMRHGEVSRGLFPGYPIRSITNGVHAATWAAPAFQDLYDSFIPSWREDPFSLRYASEIPLEDLRVAHEQAKLALLECVRRETGSAYDPSALTLGFARRATAYKRVGLIFHDLDRLTSIVNEQGPLQIVFAGKSHPHDEEGKQLIREVHRAASALEGKVAVVWLPDYGMELGRLLCAGCDVWLNTPIPPLEASGTSGMKAAMNGVPSLSLLDGWWVEGCIEGVTGWQIEDEPLAPGDASADRDAIHAAALYQKLGDVVAPCFYGDRDAYLQVCRQTIALNGSFFNSHRMALQYLYEAYLPH